MENFNFFALLFRTKYIDRWALMRNTFRDNLAEHSFDVAAIAHCLCVIGNTCFARSLNGERAAVLGLFHDMPEILTGDMPTPVKYYNENLRDLYHEIETNAAQHLLCQLPKELQAVYSSLLTPNEEDAALLPYLKAADKLAALIKCIQEREAGNSEFSGAEKGIQEALTQLDLPEIAYFMEHFIPAFSKAIDQMDFSLSQMAEK